MTKVHGQLVDEQTRCVHWHGPNDVIAIKFPCCGRYYACHECHQELETHDGTRWAADELDTVAITCGLCGVELTIADYLGSGHTCPSCRAAFNPGCANHYHLYFELDA